MSEHTREQKQSSADHFSLSNVQPEQVVQAVQRTPLGSIGYQRAHADPRSLSHAQIQMLQRTIGNRAVTQLLQRTAGNAGQVPLQEAVPPPSQASTDGLPAPLKAGVENLSGLSMDDVHVHYNSAEPAKVEALAYTQGADIHVGPGQEQHLAHEAWHVVQQKQGRVQQTTQAKGIALNDDRGLEHEADVMGAKAVHMRGEHVQAEQRNGHRENVLQARRLAAGVPIQRVYGGLEYTENMPTVLESYPGNPAGLPLVVPTPVAVMTLGATQIGFYVVHPANMPPASSPGWTGAVRDTDHEVLRSAPPGRVKLTNDTQSAEWVIEGHTVHGLTIAQMMQNIVQDITTMYTLRTTLATQINTLRGHHGDNIIIAPAGLVDLANPGPQGLFRYRPGATSAGRVQLTVQYNNIDTIRRINALNASKYLTGSKIAPGEDVAQVTGNPGLAQRMRDFFAPSSFSTAMNTLLASLVAASAPIITVAPPAGAVVLTAADVGLIKLMVINDAMASTMVRHAEDIGQSHQKNIQRFFPKSRRDMYVNAIARANVGPAELNALQGQITGAAAAMAQLVWNNVDALALHTRETEQELAAAAAGGVAAASVLAGFQSTLRRHASDEIVMPFELVGLKNLILGVNGALLANWIGRAALAYTDTSAVGPIGPGGFNTGHLPIHPVGHPHAGQPTGEANVIPSMDFTPVAGPGPAMALGAIYEFREREIPMSDGDIAAVIDALTALFNAA